MAPTKHPEKTKESDRARHQASHADHENLLAQSKQVVVDVRAEITRLKSEPAWAGGDRHGVSLVKGDGINVALMLLKKGAKLQEHHTKAPITVHLLEGRINFIAADKENVLAVGMLL